MKTFLTTAALVAALTMPAFAEGESPSTKAGESSGSVKASTSINAPDAEKGNANASGAGSVRATTGSSSMGASGGVGVKPSNLNEKAGDTSAGEAKR